MTPSTIEILMWGDLQKRNPEEAKRLREQYPELTANLDKWYKKWTQPT